MAGEPTQITRDWQKTLVNGAAAAAILAATYWLFWAPGTRPDVLSWMLSIATFTGAAFFIYRAVLRAGFAPCPGCGQRITELSTAANQGVVCRFCGKYVEGAGGRLVLTADDRVASEALFETVVPRDLQWPEGCCLCGAPATRKVTIAAWERGEAPIGKDLATRVATLGTMKLVSEVKHTLEVPHCAAHANGATLLVDGESVTGLAIAFRSHAFLVAFCDKNGTLPRT